MVYNAYLSLEQTARVKLLQALTHTISQSQIPDCNVVQTIVGLSNNCTYLRLQALLSLKIGDTLRLHHGLVVNQVPLHLSDL